MTISPIKRFFLIIFTIACSVAGAQQPPVLTATGNQVYCPGSPIPVVTGMTITDPDDTGALAVYVQISSGYVAGQEILALAGSHPNVTANWDAQAGKLTIKSPLNVLVSYTDLVSAIESVVFTNNSANPSGTRTFSISIGEANYLPSTGHYYQFIPALGITWTNARTLASQSTYYGLQGYLATLGAADEAKLSGEQASGAGWIGGTDSETEGVWKWVTGPEAGTVFWNGQVNGSTPNFAFWNNAEPNNLGEEDYAHITAPGVGIPGSWNDLTNTGGDSGDYQPKGYIVEYGGMPGDPVLNISTSTNITIPKILSVSNGELCGPGSITLQASSDTGTVNWYSSPTGGTLLHSGPTFTTPILSSTTTYYVDPFPAGCTTAARTPVTASITDIPVVFVSDPAPACSGTVTMTATTSAGQLRWFADAAGSDNVLHTGSSFTVHNLTETTTFYVDAIVDNCVLPVRMPVTAVILPQPIAADEQISLCEGRTRTLDAGVPNATYQWSVANEHTSTLDVDTPGTYSVQITNIEGCSTTKTFTVTGKSSPKIKNVLVEDTTVTINMENNGEFLFSVDGVNYQESNVFTIDQPGVHTAYVHQINDCGDDTAEFLVIIAPGFFTPNGDNVNDVWTAHGMNFLPDPYLAIFDRFGKLIAELHKGNMSWNGTYGGLHLPASDYWYIFRTSASSAEVRGHFSLVR